MIGEKSLRKDGLNCGSFTQPALNPKPAAEDDCPLPHSHRSQSGSPGFIEVNSTTVVSDHHRYLAVGPGLQQDSYLLCATVHLDVSQSLLNDSVEVEEGRRGDRLRPAGQDCQLGGGTCLCLESTDQGADGADETVANAILPPKVVKKLPEAVEDLAC